MKIGSAFPSKYLKAADLNGARILVTIDRVAAQDVGQVGSKEIKPVLYFKGKEKGLVLNKTNARKITAIAGTDETDSWTGKQIVIYPTETEFQGETVDCIRVAAPKVNNTGKPTVPPPSPEPVAGEEYGDPEAENFHASDDDVPF